MRAEESLAALIAALPKCDKCPATATRSVFEGGTYCDEHGTNWDPSMIHDLSYAAEYRRIKPIKFEDMNQRQKDEESAKGYVGGGRHEPGGMLDPNAKDE